MNVGIDITAEQLHTDFDAVVLAIGATEGRDLPVPGRQFEGITRPWNTARANRVQQGDPVLDGDGQPPITAKGNGSSSSAVATLARTAWAPPTGRCGQRAPVRDHYRARPESRADSTPCDLSADVPGVLGARGGRRAAFSVNTEKFLGHEGKGRGLRAHGRDVRRQVRLRWRAPTSNLDRPGAAGDGLRRPFWSGRVLLTDLGAGAHRPGQRRPRRRLPDLGAGRARGGRHGPQAVP